MPSMSFRRQIDYKQRAADQGGIDGHRLALKKIGLPPIIYCDFVHWADFLSNGCLDHHEDTTHFEFSQLWKDQMRQLLKFIEEEYAARGTVRSMQGWLRVKLGLCVDCGCDLR